MKNLNRKGFTLVELLIVIVVIGILSAMMMLSSTEAVSSAKAAKVISNLRNLKTAALAVYADDYDLYKDNPSGTNNNWDTKYHKIEGEADFVAAVKKHLSSKIDGLKTSISGNDDTTDDDCYAFYNGDGRKYLEWYVVYKIPKDDTALKAKLKTRAKSAGLIKGRKTENNRLPYDGDKTGANGEGGSGRAVYMRIM